MIDILALGGEPNYKIFLYNIDRDVDKSYDPQYKYVWLCIGTLSILQNTSVYEVKMTNNS